MSAYVFPVDAVSGAPSYSGRAGRQALSVLAGGGSSSRPLAGRTGVNPRTPSTTVTATSTTWTVLPHGGYLDLEAAAQAGGYLYSFDSNQTGSMTAADASNPRIDLISVQLSDPAESDGTSTPGVAIVYTTGTAAASPSAPATPARALALAQISVPKSGTGSPSVTWVARYTAAAGGIIPCSDSSVYPSSPYVGQIIDDATLGLLRWDGSTWDRYGPAGDTGWTAVPHGGSYTSAAAPEAAEMRVINGIGYMHGLFQLLAGGNFATNSTIVLTAVGSIPAAYRPVKKRNVQLASDTPGDAVRGILGTDGSLSIVTGATTGSYVDLGGFSGYPVY